MRMFLWKSRPTEEDEIPKLLKQAVEADEKGRYDHAIDLYAKAIEKMLNSLKSAKEKKKQMQIRSQINQYMTRAEYLKVMTKTRTGTNEVQQGDTATSKQPSNFIKHNDKFAHMILDEVLDRSPGVKWDDIAGLNTAKQILQEAVILPMLRPDLFTGLRAPPRGVLLFGPPGTGKTLLAKAVATEANLTFFNISASSLTSKWVGEGEKLVRALFEMARELIPAVIFIDELDSLLGSRSSNENEASRRIKNQFFIEMDGLSSNTDDRILVMGATNLPQGLDEAIIRRLEKRIYVPLPDASSRQQLIQHLFKDQKYKISSKQLQCIVKATEGYSGSDLKALCKEAALGPIRELGTRVAHVRSEEEIRPIQAQDMEQALHRIRPSVSKETVKVVEEWSEQRGVRG